MRKGTLIALLVIGLILLGASNIYVYSSMQGQVTTLQSQNNTLNTSYQSYISNHNHTDIEYDALKSDRDLLKEIVDLDKYQTFFNGSIDQPSNQYTSWNLSVSYAGYISVNVLSSTSAKTYIRAIYASYGVSFDQTITVSSSGTGVFPVLPSVGITIRVGNTNIPSEGGASETVSITYYY